MSPENKFAAAMPYPPVKVEKRDPFYACEMLSNIGSCNSEMSTLNSYLYNSTILLKSHSEISEVFRKIAIVEMHHLSIFSQLALELGADPRLWTCSGRKPVYWSPACCQYPDNLKTMLYNAYTGEQDAIRKYENQIEQIQDDYICEILQRIIEDEKLHVEIYRGFLKESDSNSSR